MASKESTAYQASRRDSFFVAIVNLILRAFVSKQYRDILQGTINLGLAAAADEEIYNLLLEKNNGNS